MDQGKQVSGNIIDMPPSSRKVAMTVGTMTLSSMHDIIETAQEISGVRVGDVLDIPTGENEQFVSNFPFAANIMHLADELSSKCLRKVIITRVFVLADLEGKISVNWLGHLQLADQEWFKHDILVARIESVLA